uniref:Uncharacterized protein n=1 Tax=Vespula pensylvanica TaxID=30213 RepID=A0A834NYN0_VESPE|nr:hypothetical protein H0235_009490 [Vespula pensylvanica]
MRSPQVEEVKWCSGDTLPFMRRYKGPIDSEWFNLAHEFQRVHIVVLAVQLNAVVGILYLVRRYKRPIDSQWSDLATNFNEHTS